MKTRQTVIKITLTLCLLVGLSLIAQADPLTLTITNPNQTGTPGTVLTFSGSLTNGAGVVSNLGNDFSFPIPAGPLTLDDSLFVTNFFGMSIASGGMSSGGMFTVTIGLGAKPGVYTGSFSILYDGLAMNLQTSQLFSVTVPQNGTSVPEPSTMLLLGAGLAGLGGMIKRRRQGKE